MKYSERYSALETTMGKYSARKIPQWRMGNHELLEYLEQHYLQDEDIPLKPLTATV